MDRPEPSSFTAQRTMQANRRTNTGPERALRSALHIRGLRYLVDHPIRLSGRRPTRPDIVFTKARVAVFVDGCFWHGCPEHGLAPKANADYWLPKLARNRERDAAIAAALEAQGWTVIRVWEHESVSVAADRIASAIEEARGRCRPQDSVHERAQRLTDADGA